MIELDPMIILLFRLGMSLILFGCGMQCGLNAAYDFTSNKTFKGVTWIFVGLIFIAGIAPVWLIR